MAKIDKSIGDDKTMRPDDSSGSGHAYSLKLGDTLGQYRIVKPLRVSGTDKLSPILCPIYFEWRPEWMGGKGFEGWFIDTKNDMDDINRGYFSNLLDCIPSSCNRR